MITVRDVSRTDAAVLADLHARTWREAYEGVLPRRAVEPVRADVGFWRHYATRLANDPTARDHAIVIAYREGEPAGFALCGPANDEDTPWTGEARMLYVLAEHARRGVGRALMDAMARRMVARGFFELGVWMVSRNDKARAFYESLGGELAAQGVQVVRGVRVDVTGYAWRDASHLFLAAGAGGRARRA